MRIGIVLAFWPMLLSAGESIPISYGVEFHRAVTSNEALTVSIDLDQEPSLIVIEPSYLNVVVSVIDASGKELIRADSPPFEYGGEHILFTPQSAGNYSLRISPHQDNADPGEVKFRVLKPDYNAQELNAARLSTRASEVEIAGENEERLAALNSSLDLYKASAVAWESASNDELQGLALSNVAWLAFEIGDFELAESSFIRSLSLRKDADIEASWKHSYLGAIFLEYGAMDRAQSNYTQALALAKKSKDSRGRAAFHNDMGLFHQYQSNPAAAAIHYDRALDALEGVKYSHQKATTLGNVGGVHYQMGQFSTALEYYLKALEAHRLSNDTFQQAIVLGNMSSLLRDQGDLTQSLEYLLQSLAIYRQLGDKTNTDHAYHRLGILFQRMGDYHRSEAYYLRAYDGRKSSGSPRRAASTLRNLGSLYGEQQLTDKATEVQYQALAYYLQIDSSADSARTQLEIARGMIAEKDYLAAKTLLDAAIPVLRGALLYPELADAMTLLGKYTAQTGDLEAAKSYLDEALSLHQQVSDPIGEINTLIELASLDREPDRAVDVLTKAEKIAKRIHSGLGNPALKARFSASLQKLYDSIVARHLQLYSNSQKEEHINRAFLASERNRSRSLLELANTGTLQQEKNSNPLLVQQMELRRQLNALWSSTSRLRANSDNSEIQKLVVDNDAAINDVMTQLDNVAGKLALPTVLSSGNPAFSVRDIQASLAADELLLHIHLGEQQSAIWRLTSESVTSQSLPPRNVVNAMAKAAYNSLLESRHSTVDREKIQALTDFLIDDPSALAGVRHVYLVADGFLQQIPLGALMDKSGSYLSASVTSTNLPASRVLLKREKPSTFDKKSSIIAYADPVFGNTDFRARSTDNDILIASDLTRAAIGLGLDKIIRLPFSSFEAKSIVDSVPSAVIVRGFDANKKDIGNRDLLSADVLHFATHGIVNENIPQLSGLVLSLIDQNNEQRDGFLSVSEINSLQMDPHLVVLSACETGIGEVVPGEGLLSLARAFHRQGADYVVSSLWRVSDRATAELMGHFYQGLVEQKLPIAQALRYAQLKTSQQPRWQAPYYWAGFVTSSVAPSLGSGT